LTPSELVLTFGGCYLCAIFWQKSIKKCDREIADRQTHAQRQTEFIICPIVYAIAMGQITVEDKS